MPYIIRNKNGEPVGVIAHPSPDIEAEYVKPDHPDIKKYKDWKETRHAEKEAIKKKINAEMKRIAIKNLKEKQELPEDYPET